MFIPIMDGDHPEGRPYALITGASRGIGAAYARALASQGYDLLLVSRDAARLSQLASELVTQHRVAVDTEILDLAAPEAAHRLYVAARQRRQAVDLLINNAGFGLFGAFVDLPMPQVQAMLRLHVNTVVESIRLFLPGMIDRRSGAIINVSSVAGFFSIPFMAEYAATKAFLITFTEALAEEVAAKGVKLQACCPGSTETDFHTTAGYRPKNPLRAQTAEEVVAKSLAALRSGRTTVTTRWPLGVMVVLSRLAPRGWVPRAASSWMKRQN